MPPTVFVGPGTLIIGDPASGDAFSCDLTEARLSDVSPVYSEVTGCGTQSRNGEPDLELTVTVVQDVATVDSLTLQSWTLHNQVQPFIFLPNVNQGTAADISPTTPGIQGQVLVTRLDVGGNATSLATASKTWKVQGDVTLITTPPALAAAAA